MADEQPEETPLGERLLDVLVFAPAGLILSAVEELPKYATIGRERLGMKASSAKMVGEFAVRMGRQEVQRRAGDLLGRGRGPFAADADEDADEDTDEDGTTAAAAAAGEEGGHAGEAPTARLHPVGPPPASRPRGAVVPPSASLGIPAFDTLSASQVVQRLDGLTREELAAVRAYEEGTRGRRTVLGRVDQLLDERS